MPGPSNALAQFLAMVGGPPPPPRMTLADYLRSRTQDARTVTTPLSVADEIAFRMWYDQQAKQLGLDPDPDSPYHLYDYRGAFKAGANAQVIPEDGLPHWPSTFKREGHPNLVVDGMDTRTGEPADPSLLARYFGAAGALRAGTGPKR